MKDLLLEQNYTYDECKDYTKALAYNYPNILRLKTYGYTHDHRKLFLIRIGHGPCKVFCSAGVHGRESINPIVMLKTIETYTKLYSLNNQSINCKFKSVLNRASIVFVPFVNPDGYEISQYGFNSIRDFVLRNRCKNLGIPFYEWKYNARGVDLNRNFSSNLWQPKYENDYCFSELESISLKKALDLYNPNIYIDFHSRGDSIYCYRSQKGIIYNNHQYKLAKIIASITGYNIYPCIYETLDNDSGGNTVHYVSEYLNRAAITIETIDENETFPLNVKLARKVFNKISKIPLILADL